MAEEPPRGAPLIRLALAVEGRTEEEWVKSMLAGHLRTRGVEVTPVLLGKARNRGKGGNVSIPALVGDMKRLSRSFDAVSSLVDFYGFRGKKARTVDVLTGALSEELRRELGPSLRLDRVIPYVQLHEFEGLLFSQPAAFRLASGATDEAVAELSGVRARFASPEDINDSAETAPSKRIHTALPRYRKVVDGPRIARRIGLEVMRQECARFHAWLERLETLAGPQA